MPKKEKPLDLQSELFEEWEEQKNFREHNRLSFWESLFDSSLLKKTKVTLSYDTILLGILMFIFVFLTIFLLGVQYGKTLRSRTIITLEKTPSHSPSSLELVSSEDLHRSSPKIGKSKAPVSLSRKNSQKSSQDLKKSKILSKNLSPSKAISQKVFSKPELPRYASSLKKKTLRMYRYTIQIGASCDLSASEKDIQKIQKKGYNAFIVPYVSSNRKHWYKLCIGRFKNMANARSFMKTFQRKERKKDCFITNL